MRQVQITVSSELRDDIRKAKGESTYEDFLLFALSRTAEPDLVDEAGNILDILDQHREGLSREDYLTDLINPELVPEGEAETEAHLDIIEAHNKRLALAHEEAIEAIVKALGDHELIDRCRRMGSADYTRMRACKLLGLPDPPGVELAPPGKWGLDDKQISDWAQRRMDRHLGA